MNLKIDRERLEVMREVCSKYGIKIISSVVLAICLLGVPAKSDYNLDKLDDESNYSKIEKSVYLGNIKRDTIRDALTFQNDEVLSFQEKVEKILNLYHLTYEELDVCCAIACAEANGEGMNYEEASNVINAAYNRIISAKWVASLGDHLYDQMTAPDQFVVYQNGNYLRFLGRTDLPGYQAVIDFLSNTTKLLPHSYLSFRSNGSNIDGVELVLGGNLYFNVLEEEDKLTDFRVSDQSLVLGKNYF